MDFHFSDEQRAVKETIRKFLARECPREVVREWDGQGTYPGEQLRKIAAIGFCGLAIPEEYGGAGADVLGAVLVAEALSTVYPALGAAFVAPTFCGGRNVAVLGSTRQREQYLPGLVEGELLFAYGLVESSNDWPGQSPVATKAVRSGNGFRLHGSKAFVRLADRADYLLTLATTDPALDASGLSLFVVDLHQPGIRTDRLATVGYRGADLHKVLLEDVAVSDEDLLGGPEWLNRAIAQLPRLVETESLEVAACAAGIAQGAYEYAADYAKHRVQFDQPIAEFGAVEDMLVEMAVQSQAARLFTYWASVAATAERPTAVEALMARAQATKAARKAALYCLQIMGGYGYAMEYDAQRYVRDSVVLLGGAAAPEVTKHALGLLLGLRDKAT